MRPGMFDDYRGCARRIGPLLLVGLLMWVGIIYAASRAVAWLLDR